MGSIDAIPPFLRNRPQTASGDVPPFLKKKDGLTGTSLNPIPYESPVSTSNSPSEESVNQSIQNYQNKKLSTTDVDVLSQTYFGKENGFNNFTPEQKKFYVEAHNAPTMQSNRDAVKTIVDDYAPKINDKNVQELIQGVQSGDPIAVNKFKSLVIGDLDNKINEIKSNPAGEEYSEFLPQGFGARTTKKKLTPEQAASYKELEAKKKNAASQLDEYVADALVEKSMKAPEDYYKKTDSNRFLEIGRQQRKFQEGDDQYFKTIDATAGLDTKSKNAKTFQNYQDEAAGLQTYIQWKEKKLAQLTQDAIKSKDPNAAKQAGAEATDIQDLYDQLNTLALNKYPAVAYNQWARAIGDKIASKKGFNAYVSPNDVREASAQLVKENPALAEVAERYTLPLAKGEGGFGDVPLQGFMGGVSRSFREGAEGASNLVKNFFGSRSAKDRKADEIINQFDAERQGTSYSGITPSKVILDKNGVAFKEIPNEHYGSYDWNNVLAMAGSSVGQILQQGLLTEGIGAAGGLIAKPIIGAVNKVGGEVNTLARTLLGESKPVFDAAKEGLKFGKEAQLWTGLIGSTYMQAYDQNLGLAEKMVNGKTPLDDFKRNTAANMMTLASAATERILPDNELIKANFFKAIGKDALAVLEDIGEKGLTKEAFQGWLANSVKPRLTSFIRQAGKNVENSVKEGAEEIIDNKFQNLTMALFDENNNKQNTTSDDIQAFTSAALGTLALGLPAQVRSGFTHTGKAALWNVGLNPDEYISKINDAVTDGSLTQQQADGMIKIASSIGQEVDKIRNKTTSDGQPLSLKQQQNEAIANFRANAAAELAKTHESIKPEQIAGEAKDIATANAQNPQWQEISSKTNPVLKEIGVDNLTDIDLNKEYEVSTPDGNKVPLKGSDIVTLVTAHPVTDQEESRIQELTNKTQAVHNINGDEVQPAGELTKKEQAELDALQSKKNLLSQFQSVKNEEAQATTPATNTEGQNTNGQEQNGEAEISENKNAESEVKPTYKKVDNNIYQDEQGNNRYIVSSGNRDTPLVEVDEETYNKWKQIDDGAKERAKRIKESSMPEENKSSALRALGETTAKEKRDLLGTPSGGEQKAFQRNTQKVQKGDKTNIKGVTYEVIDPSIYGKVRFKGSDGSDITVPKTDPIVQQLLSEKKNIQQQQNYIGAVPATGTVEEYLGANVKGRKRVSAAEAKKLNAAALAEKKSTPSQEQNIDTEFENKFGVNPDALIKQMEEEGLITRIC